MEKARGILKECSETLAQVTSSLPPAEGVVGGVAGARKEEPMDTSQAKAAAGGKPVS